jgi:type IV pilus assembly protein PilM
MSILSGISDFFGLDIGTTAIRVVQLKGTGPIKALSLYGYVDANFANNDTKEEQAQIAQTVRQVVDQAGIRTKNVAVNLTSSRVFTTVIEMDRMAPGELSKALRYQAESFIPTPIAESKIDWAVIGDSPTNAEKVEVLLTSVNNSFIEARLDMLESIGLNVIAFEPDSMALTRAVIPTDVVAPQMVIDMGNRSTDLVVTMNGSPHLTRIIPTGLEAVIRSASQILNVDQNQAEQFVLKFGLSKDKLESQVYNAILPTVDTLIAEIEKSIKFFQTRYTTIKIERIVVTGGASVLPEFPIYIANKFGISVEIGNAWRNVSFPASQQNELMALSNHFAVAVGLAERRT